MTEEKGKENGKRGKEQRREREKGEWRLLIFILSQLTSEVKLGREGGTKFSFPMK